MDSSRGNDCTEVGSFGEFGDNGECLGFREWSSGAKKSKTAKTLRGDASWGGWGYYGDWYAGKESISHWRFGFMSIGVSVGGGSLRASLFGGLRWLLPKRCSEVRVGRVGVSSRGQGSRSRWCHECSRMCQVGVGLMCNPKLVAAGLYQPPR